MAAVWSAGARSVRRPPYALVRLEDRCPDCGGRPGFLPDTYLHLRGCPRLEWWRERVLESRRASQQFLDAFEREAGVQLGAARRQAIVEASLRRSGAFEAAV
jgi:hypothetical protein